MEERVEAINNLNIYISEMELKLDKILNDFNWNKNNLSSKENNYKVCPFNSDHKISNKNFHAHVEKCELHKSGIRKKAELLEKTSHYYEGKNIAAIKLDKNMQSEIIYNSMQNDPEMKLGVPINELNSRNLPQSYTDLVVNFSQDEKLALYKYYVLHTGHFPEPEISIPVDDLGHSSKVMTFAEIVAFKRNLKRRRMKYRVSKELLSHTEEVRNLISTHMEAFIQFVGKGNIANRSKKSETLLHDKARIQAISHPESSLNKYVRDIDDENYKYKRKRYRSVSKSSSCLSRRHSKKSKSSKKRSHDRQETSHRHHSHKSKKHKKQKSHRSKKSPS